MMRIIIEIENDEPSMSARLPNSITIAFPEGRKKADESDTLNLAVSEPDENEEDLEAGSAPNDFDQFEPDESEPTEISEMDLEDDSDYEFEENFDDEVGDAGSAPFGDIELDDQADFEEMPLSSDSAESDAGVAPDFDEDTEDVFSEAEAPVEMPVDGAIIDDEIPEADAGSAPETIFEEELEDIEEGMLIHDNLTVIDGIGPKIASVLFESGITSYTQIASASVDQLKQIMSNAGITANVENWSTQAERLG